MTTGHLLGTRGVTHAGSPDILTTLLLPGYCAHSQGITGLPGASELDLNPRLSPFHTGAVPIASGCRGLLGTAQAQVAITGQQVCG